MTDGYAGNGHEIVKLLILEGTSSLFELLHLIIYFYVASHGFKNLYKSHHHTRECIPSTI